MADVSRGKALSAPVEGNRLVIVLDRSASMSYDNKLARARQLAMGRFIDLRGEGEFSVIAFDHLAEILIPISPKRRLGSIADALERVSDRGNTNIGLALRTAADLLRDEGGQVLLLSDGRANVALNGGGSEGDPTIEREIAEVAEQLSGRGVMISAIALGEDSFVSLLERPTRITGGELLVDAKGKLEKTLDLHENEVVVRSFPRDLPAGKPTWTKELNTKHVTVASRNLCSRFEESKTCFLLNPKSNERARVSLLSIEDAQLAPFRNREPKTAREVSESSAVLVDRTYRRILGLHRGDVARLCM